MSNSTHSSDLEPPQGSDAAAALAGAAPEAPPAAAAQPTAAERLNQALSQAFGDAVQSGPSDQLRGYANEAMGRTKLAVGLAIRSPELALAGIAQGALGAVQRYVGEAKMAAEAGAAEDARAEGDAVAAAAPQD